MAQTKPGWLMSFSLSAKNKGQSVARSALFSASWRRSGCSPAGPILILEENTGQEDYGESTTSKNQTPFL